MGLLWAVVLTALGFMSIHASQLAESWGPLLVLFLVGSVLTLVRAFKQSVAASVLVHMGYNGTLFIMLLTRVTPALSSAKPNSPT